MSTRPCARCGTRISSDRYLCADCLEERTSAQPEPATERTPTRTAPAPSQVRERQFWRGRPLARGMVLPSRTQYHGTMFGFIAIAVAITMAAAVFINQGIGPFAVTQVATRSSNG